MGRSATWRATLAMPANSGDIQLGAVLFMVTDVQHIRTRAKES